MKDTTPIKRIYGSDNLEAWARNAPQGAVAEYHRGPNLLDAARRIVPEGMRALELSERNMVALVQKRLTPPPGWFQYLAIKR